MKAHRTLKDVEKEHYYHLCLLRSLESKLDRVEPYSNEFDALLEQLFSTKEALKIIFVELVKLRHTDTQTYFVKIEPANDQN